jgi:chromosomal replication initiation ATPase DnaA
MSVERGGLEGISVLPRPAFSDIQRCLDAVSEATNVSLLDLLSDRRSRPLARPRQLAMWLARKSTLKSLPQIGRAMRRDHTSVLHGVAVIEKLRCLDPEMKALSDRLLAKLTETEWRPRHA